jgi:hypothetical protein
MSANFSNVTDLLSVTNCKPSVVALTETWLDDHNQDLFHLDGYKFYNKNRSGMKKGGGVGIFIADQFNVKLLNDMSVTNNIIESIFVEVSCKFRPNEYSSSQVLIGCIYRPPGGKLVT